MKFNKNIDDIKGIYFIKNIKNDKFYIGSTNNFQRRFLEHKRDFELGIHCNHYLQAAWNIDGSDSFEFYIQENLYKNITEVELRNIEQGYLDQHFGNFNRCYNLLAIATGPIGELTKEPIVQINKDSDEIIKKWNSITDASNSLNLNLKSIQNACSGRSKTSGGFTWKYLDEIKANKSEIKKLNKKNLCKRKIYEINKETKEIIKIYESITEASKLTGIDFRKIQKICCGKINSTYKIEFKYY